MKYVGAYLLSAMGGDASKDKVTAILEAAGLDIDADLLATVMSKVEGKSVEEVMSAGTGKEFFK